MEFKIYRLKIVVYLIFIILLSIGGFYILLEKYYWMVSFWLFFIDFFLIVLFFKYTQKEHQKLSYFISSISQEDFSLPDSKKISDQEINKAFKKLSSVVKSLREEAEINYQYLQMIINQVDVAIICANDYGEIVLSNNSANQLFGRIQKRGLSSLSKIDPGLPHFLNDLKINEKKLLRLNQLGVITSFSVHVAEFRILKDKYRLFTLNNVQSELEYNEIEAWQRLTRVITHEIMNSAIPISNLSSLVYSQLYTSEGNYIGNITEEQKADIKESLQTISNRSKALADFIKATKNFTKMPKPEPEVVQVSAMIKRVTSLLKQKIKDSNINLRITSLPDNISILADKSLIEQALINVLLNAIEALENSSEPVITINASKNDKNQILITLADNGPGIRKEILENIFVPFYTTKKNGSGVGLSLSKHIMLLHKGNLLVSSVSGEGSVFTLVF